MLQHSAAARQHLQPCPSAALQHALLMLLVLLLVLLLLLLLPLLSLLCSW